MLTARKQVFITPLIFLNLFFFLAHSPPLVKCVLQQKPVPPELRFARECVSSGPQFLPFPLETCSVLKQRSQLKIRSLCERIPSRVLDDFMPLGPSPLQKCVTRYKHGGIWTGGSCSLWGDRGWMGNEVMVSPGGSSHSTVFLNRAQMQLSNECDKKWTQSLQNRLTTV